MNDATVVFFILVLIGLSTMLVWARRTEEDRDARAFRAATGASLSRPQANPVAGLFGLLALLVAGFFGLFNPMGFVGIALGSITAAVAASRGSPNFLGWWGLGALLPVLSIPFAFLARDRRQDALIAVARAAARRRGDDEDEDDEDEADDYDPFDGPPAGGYPSWVAGLAHRPLEVRRRAAAARPGDALRLVRDPFNEVDPRAVKLFLGGDWIGFVPARHVGWVSERMDAGRPMLASIEAHEVLDGAAVRIWTRLRTS